MTEPLGSGAHPQPRAARAAASLLLLLLRQPAARAGSFVYPDFNDTQGLVLNRDAATTSCVRLEGTAAYGDHEGDADQRQFVIGARSRDSQCPGGNCEPERSHADSNSSGSADHYLLQGLREQADVHGVHTEFVVTSTDDPATTGALGGAGTGHAAGTAGFGHRDDYAPAKATRCAGRVRLNPSGPSKRGSAWYHLPLSVLTGFETSFTFQISDHSRECSTHKDPAFSTQMYESCATHGGDGFAFVLQRDPNGSAALGAGGRGLGYEGIANSVAVEFDTWFNPDTNTTATGVDLAVDHVAVHSRGTDANSAAESASVAQQRPHALGDGAVHLVKVVYVPFVAVDYIHRFSALPQTVQYLKDNDENRRLGTLLVFLDDGVAADEPLLAVPINLSVLLTLPQDQAFAGFTASTGLKWQKHDLLSWAWCGELPCPPSHQTDFESSVFDYAQKGARSSAVHARYVPGPGFGGVERIDPLESLVPAKGGFASSTGLDKDRTYGGAASTRHESPDSDAKLDRAKGNPNKRMANRVENADAAPGSGGYHEHGSAAHLPLFHHSQNRNEGLLYPDGERESTTQTSNAARDASAYLQVPAAVQAASYEASEGPADVYRRAPNDRFGEGTELRKK